MSTKLDFTAGNSRHLAVHQFIVQSMVHSPGFTPTPIELLIMYC